MGYFISKAIIFLAIIGGFIGLGTLVYNYFKQDKHSKDKSDEHSKNDWSDF